MLFTFFFVTLLHTCFVFFTFNKNSIFMGVGWVGTSIIHLFTVYQAVFDDQFASSLLPSTRPETLDLSP